MVRRLTTKQVAKRLGLHPSRIRALADRGDIHGQKFADRWMFSEQAVREFEQREQEHPRLPFRTPAKPASQVA